MAEEAKIWRYPLLQRETDPKSMLERFYPQLTVLQAESRKKEGNMPPSSKIYFHKDTNGNEKQELLGLAAND